MALDWLKEPVSEEEPCGPDLEATDDDAFVDYFYEAESRMPERYFVPGTMGPDDPGTVFDQKSIAHKDERKTIEALLKRSRDLRLLSLQARFMILAGRLPDFAEALDGLAQVLEEFPNDVHPKDTSDRRAAIDELGGSTVAVFPLQYVNLAGSGEVTYRRYLVANGQAEPRDGEEGLNSGAMLSEIAAPGNRQAVEAAHAALTLSADALHRIKSACLRADTPFTPSLGETISTIAAIQEMMHSGRSDLVPWSAEGVQGDTEETEAAATAAEDETTEGDAAQAPEPAATAPAPTATTSVANRAAALQTLSAIEKFLATHEPASPALLLITQARLLVGRPLIEAIETLMPEAAGQTKITFGSDTGFVLHMDRLRMLTGEGSGQASAEAQGDPGPAPVITDRSGVSGLINAAEEYFRVREPASPIPVLLFKARTYLDKDFSAIVADLIPPKADG